MCLDKALPPVSKEKEEDPPLGNRDSIEFELAGCGNLSYLGAFSLGGKRGDFIGISGCENSYMASLNLLKKLYEFSYHLVPLQSPPSVSHPESLMSKMTHSCIAGNNIAHLIHR